MTQIKDSLAKSASIVSNLESNLVQLRHCLPSTIKGATDNPVATGRLIRRLIASLVRLQNCRKSAHDFCDLASSISNNLAYETSFKGPQLRRNYPTLRCIEPTVDVSVAIADDLATHKKLCERYNSVVLAIHSLSNSFSGLVVSLREQHAAIVKRKATCLGYYDNVSALLAFGASKPRGSQPNFNLVFGSCRNVELLTFARRPLVASKEVCPTLKHGESVILSARLDRQIANRSNSTKCKAERINAVGNTIARMYPFIRFDNHVLALIPHYAKINACAARWGSTRLHYQGVSTLPTSKPIEVATTPRGERVFEMNAVWVETVAWKPGQPRINLNTVVEGKIYFVVYGNESENTRYSVFHGSADRNLESIIVALDKRANLERDRLERDRVAKLSSRQQIAKLLRDCRAIPVVSLDDSYRAGNCRPGTHNFCSTLGIDVTSTPALTGKQLARLWNEHERPQLNLLRNVIATVKRELATN